MNGNARSSTRNQQQPFEDFNSIYHDPGFFDSARNNNGRQSVPVGFRAGELFKNFGTNNEATDTSSGYSTASSSIAPSSSTYWTRKGGGM